MSEHENDTAATLISDRQIAAGSGWSLNEYVCSAGPGNRPFEERHDGFSIAAVVEGAFTYASGAGRALLHPGALLLGNDGACFECGHDHGIGDRCVSLKLEPDYFAEIAATAAGSSRFRFPTGMLPSIRDLLPHQILLEAAPSRDPLRLEEELIRFASATIRALSGEEANPARVSAQDEKRIGRTLRHIERHADEALDLDQLAQVATMSKFHFLRVFRRAVGMTPYQFLLGVRFRRAGLRLLTTSDPISTIAFDCGFGDLSTFNRSFHERFGVNPQVFRKNGAI